MRVLFIAMMKSEQCMNVALRSGFVQLFEKGALKEGKKKTPEPIETTCPRVHGADSQIRTGDLILTKDALYRLSYISMLSFDNGQILS